MTTDKADAKKKDAGLRFTKSTKDEPEKGKHSLMTSSSTCVPPSQHHTAQRSSSDPGHDDRDDDAAINSDHGVIFHKKAATDYKFACVYWRHGFSLPENGRMVLTKQALAFKGIIGTKMTFELKDVSVAKTSRMGGLVHDCFTVNSNDAEGGKYLFSTVLKDRKKILDKVSSAIAAVKLQKEEEEFDTISGRSGGANKEKKFRMPPDLTLQKMNVLAHKKLKGVSVQDYYNVAWSAGNDKDPLYQTFLEQQGKNNVAVGPWEKGDYEGDWCGEKYTEERVVTFDFMKKTIGQTLVQVKHTQRFRRKDNDQCIVQIKMEMKGFPYADCFVVEVRHVASRAGENDLSVQIGMHVNFIKSCMLSGKIKANTGAETTKAQLALLEMTCAPFAVAGLEEESESEDEDGEEEAQKREDALTKIAPKNGRGPIELPEPLFKPKLFDFAPDNIDEAVRNARTRLKMLEEITLASASKRRRNDILREMALINKSVDRIEKMATSNK